MKLNRTLVLCLSIVLAASMALGGTLAFLTDTESKVNEFTVGEVDITLDETFVQGSKLTPGQKVQKEVYIKNDGTNDAYVWFTYALPSIANHETDASQNVLHTNTKGAYWDEYRENNAYWVEGQTVAVDFDKTWNIDFNLLADGSGEDVENNAPIGQVKIPTLSTTGETVEVEYDVYVNLYNGLLPVGVTTNPGMSTVYLDANVDCIDGKYYLVKDGKQTLLTPDAENPIGIDQLKVIVNAYAIQADGFEDAISAYKAYLGQWGMQTMLDNVVKAVTESANDNTAP